MAVARSWDGNFDPWKSGHTPSSSWRKITPSATNLFYCLDLSEKQLLQAPNADTLMVVAHVLHQEFTSISILGFILEQQKLLFYSITALQDYADTVFGSYYICWPNYRMLKELIVFGMCIWKIAWRMIIKLLSHFFLTTRK